MKIIGFDLSLRSSCACIYNSDEDFRFIMFVLKDKDFKGLDSITKDVRRMFLISEWVCKTVNENGGGFVGIEDLAYGLNSSATSKLAGLKHVVLHELARIECQPIMVSPSEARKHYFGKANDKKMVKEGKKKDKKFSFKKYVFDTLRARYQHILNDDMADSFLVARFISNAGVVLEESHEPTLI